MLSGGYYSEAMRSELADMRAMTAAEASKERLANNEKFALESHQFYGLLNKITAEEKYIAGPSGILNTAQDFIDILDAQFKETNNGYERMPEIELLKSANQLLQLLSQPARDEQVLANAKGDFIARATQYSKRLAPTYCDKFLGVVGMFLGAIVAIASLSLYTNLAKNSYRLFTGYKSQKIDNFKNELKKSSP